MAEVEKLRKFDDLSLIGNYAERFGLDPDYVAENTSFDTVTKFTWMWKDNAEYQERYQYIYGELTKDNGTNNP
jgi:hypothetical protein